VDLSTVELAELLQKIEHSMQRRKSTLRQRNYFNGLLDDLRLLEDIPRGLFMYEKEIVVIGASEETAKRGKTLNSGLYAAD